LLSTKYNSAQVKEAILRIVKEEKVIQLEKVKTHVRKYVSYQDKRLINKNILILKKENKIGIGLTLKPMGERSGILVKVLYEL
jgi:hypothetical protein